MIDRILLETFYLFCFLYFVLKYLPLYKNAFEHSDSSFVYRFMSWDYGLGTMIATIIVLILASL